MKIKYDSDADAMYIILRKGVVDHTKEVDENTIIDFDKNKKVIGVEILFVKERMLLKKFQIENIVPN